MAHTDRSRRDYVERTLPKAFNFRPIQEATPFKFARPLNAPPIDQRAAAFRFIPVEHERPGRIDPDTGRPCSVFHWIGKNQLWSELWEKNNPSPKLPPTPLWEDLLVLCKIRQPALYSRFYTPTPALKSSTSEKPVAAEIRGFQRSFSLVQRFLVEGRLDQPVYDLNKEQEAALDLSTEAFMSSFAQVGTSYVATNLPISDPEENAAREQARLAEAAGLQVVNNAGVATPEPIQSSPGSLPLRQDFSNEKSPKKEGTKLGNYFLGKTLGEGEFGKVKLGWRPGATTQVAIKIIKKEKLQDSTRMQKVFREVNILRGLNHPNIVRLHDMVETDRYIGIVLEYAPCGELFNFILQRRYLKDSHAKRLFAQLVSAVGYLHKMGIIHRDLKLENLLLDRNHNLLVTDFGFANKFDPTDMLSEEAESRLNDRAYVDKHKLGLIQHNGFKRGDLMSTSCGSPCYAAPELVISDGLYTGRKVDVWSVGVILYAMLAGYLPYDDDPRNPDGDNITLLYQYISDTDLKFPDYVTPHARDLLKRILKPDPRERADLFEVARHSWLSGYENVVESITSATATAGNISDVAATSNGRNAPPLGRSSSAREPSNPTQSPTQQQAGALLSKHGNVGDLGDSMNEGSVTQRSPNSQKKRQTVQVEYLAPQRQRDEEMDPEDPDWYRAPPAPGLYPLEWHDYDKPLNERKRLWQEKQYNKGKGQIPEGAGIRPVVPEKDESPPSRPNREPQRSVTDSNFGAISTSRPLTAGSIGDPSRLPSRGSYGQPVAAQVATTSAQGRFSQPRPTGSAPYGAYGQQDGDSAPYVNGRGGQAEKPVRLPTPDGSTLKRGHARSHTLSDLTQKVFGRTPSTKKTSETRPRPDRSHPPTAMKPIGAGGPRKSGDSRHSFGVGRKSSDLKETTPKRGSKRFSFIPRWGNSKSDLTNTTTGESMNETQRPQVYSSTMDGSNDGPPSRGQYATQNAISNPPTPYSQSQAQGYGSTRTATTNDTQGTYPRNVSAGSAMATNVQPAQARQPSQQWPAKYEQGDETDAPSRFDSPATTTAGYNARTAANETEKAKAPWESDNWSSNKKWHQTKSGPAQRVMDFFRGRRHERTGMA